MIQLLYPHFKISYKESMTLIDFLTKIPSDEDYNFEVRIHGSTKHSFQYILDNYNYQLFTANSLDDITISFYINIQQVDQLIDYYDSVPDIFIYISDPILSHPSSIYCKIVVNGFAF